MHICSTCLHSKLATHGPCKLGSQQRPHPPPSRTRSTTYADYLYRKTRWKVDSSNFATSRSCQDVLQRAHNPEGREGIKTKVKAFGPVTFEVQVGPSAVSSAAS